MLALFVPIAVFGDFDRTDELEEMLKSTPPNVPFPEMDTEVHDVAMRILFWAAAWHDAADFVLSVIARITARLEDIGRTDLVQDWGAWGKSIRESRGYGERGVRGG